MTALRIGQGFDVHRFATPEEGRPLMLMGCAIPHDRGLAGHSDADVMLHALMDALLGAAGLGDIGHTYLVGIARDLHLLEKRQCIRIQNKEKQKCIVFDFFECGNILCNENGHGVAYCHFHHFRISFGNRFKDSVVFTVVALVHEVKLRFWLHVFLVHSKRLNDLHPNSFRSQLDEFADT